MQQKKKNSGLLFRFSVIFAIFTSLMLIMSGILTYMNQMHAYRDRQEERLRKVTTTLANILENNVEEIYDLQEYFSTDHEKVLIPYDFDGNYVPAKEEYYRLFHAEFPDRDPRTAVSFSDYSEELRQAFAIYKYEYYLSIFENFQDAFEVEYIYYLFPTGKGNQMIYLYEGERNERVINGKSYMAFQFYVDVDPKLYPKLWEAWNTGKSPSGFDYYNNEHGVTYGAYTPVIYQGKSLGIVGADLTVESVNKGILHETNVQTLGMAAVMVFCIAFMLIFIDRRYIVKLHRLEEEVNKYAATNDTAIAKEIEDIADGDHEIATLASRISAMIVEIDEHIHKLLETTKELYSTREQAAALDEMAHKDALTGIRNRHAFEKEEERLNREIRNGTAEFAIAMIDLNYLKRINDTFGHEMGNIAIRKLCTLVCRIFIHSPVFRVGGDEFVVVLRGYDLEHAGELFGQLQKELDMMAADPTLQPWEKVSAAFGMAHFDPETDDTAANVFSRADQLMYENKKQMKAQRE